MRTTSKKGNMETATEEKTEIAPTEAELRELGMTKAADEMKNKREMARKLRIAFEHFRVVTPDQVARFQRELQGKAERALYSGAYEYQALKFTPLALYPNVPPGEVLTKIKEAKALECFDAFEVLTLETVKVIPDPVVFGIIAGCDNKYFVAQWDDDVKIEQILREDEG